jgi:hypothetical protein
MQMKFGEKRASLLCSEIAQVSTARQQKGRVKVVCCSSSLVCSFPNVFSSLFSFFVILGVWFLKSSIFCRRCIWSPQRDVGNVLKEITCFSESKFFYFLQMFTLTLEDSADICPLFITVCISVPHVQFHTVVRLFKRTFRARRPVFDSR